MSTRVERIVALGDSLMLGLGTINGIGWVQMLHARYKELNANLSTGTRCPRIFYELGSFAARAQDVAERVTHETQSRLWIPNEKDYDKTKRLSIVSIGVNDSWLRAKDRRHVTPIADFSAHIGRIATDLSSQSNVLSVGLLPCREDLCSKFWDTPTPPQLESRVAYEEEALRAFRMVGARTVPLTLEAYNSAEYMHNLTEDGVHGSELCERWIYERVVPDFDELVGVDVT